MKYVNTVAWYNSLWIPVINSGYGEKIVSWSGPSLSGDYFVRVSPRALVINWEKSLCCSYNL